MSIRLRNNRYIVDYYPNGRKGRRSVFTLPEGTTEEEARQVERGCRSRHKTTVTANSTDNIIRLIKSYNVHCLMHQSPETARDKQSHFNAHILPFFGHMHIDEITPAHITAFKQQMQKKTYREKVISNRTITKGLNYFSAFIKWADEELNIRPINPIKFRKLPSIRPVPTILSLDESMKFINSADKLCRLAYHCPGNPKCHNKVAYNVIFKIFFYLGLRNRAVRKLKWENIDWTKQGIKTTEKGDKVKWHPLPDDLHDELKSMSSLQSYSEWIFPSPTDTRKPIGDLKKAVARAKDAAGITKRVYPHLLRHSIATHLVDSDVDIRQIQAFLGHSHISTTEWYAQVSLEKKRQALEKAGIVTRKGM